MKIVQKNNFFAILIFLVIAAHFDNSTAAPSLYLTDKINITLIKKGKHFEGYYTGQSNQSRLKIGNNSPDVMKECTVLFKSMKENNIGQNVLALEWPPVANKATMPGWLVSDTDIIDGHDREGMNWSLGFDDVLPHGCNSGFDYLRLTHAKHNDDVEGNTKTPSSDVDFQFKRISSMPALGLAITITNAEKFELKNNRFIQKGEVFSRFKYAVMLRKQGKYVELRYVSPALEVSQFWVEAATVQSPFAPYKPRDDK